MALCGHTFHYECINKIIAKSSKCPICSKQIKKTDIFMVSHEKQEYNEQGEITGKSALVDLLGTKLANMICYLMSIEDSVIIFSQWDELLRKVGDILNQFGISNRFCRGNVHTRDKAIRDFMESKEIKAIMLSSQSSASGANMTKATKILFLDPIYGTPEYITNTEWQAIGRAYRMGQENDVEIIRFITNNTIESDIYKQNIKDRENSISIDIDEVIDDTIVISNDKLKIINEYVKQYRNNMKKNT
jgi:SNF2 family DNA or RNA helicase